MSLKKLMPLKVLKDKGALSVVNVSGRGDKDVEREM